MATDGSARTAPHGARRGFLNIDKPEGVSSFDVIRRIRRATGMRRVGHAGILDQPASGVLPVALGEATRLIEEVMDARKGYITTIVLGVETDTYDAAGAVLASAPAAAVAAIDRAQVEAALAPFTGEFLQQPPAYSAIKRGGVAAHEAARRGEPLDLEPRPVRTYALRLLGLADGLAEVEIECGRGFYVRSLAHDLGAALGVGAHVRRLRRTAVGRFRITDATPLDEAEQRLAAGDWEALVHAPDAVLTAWPALLLGRAAVAELRLGREVIPLPGTRSRVGRPNERARGYGPDGTLVALVETGRAPGAWHPYRVFPAGDPS